MGRGLWAAAAVCSLMTAVRSGEIDPRKDVRVRGDGTVVERDGCVRRAPGSFYGDGAGTEMVGDASGGHVPPESNATLAVLGIAHQIGRDRINAFRHVHEFPSPCHPCHRLTSPVTSCCRRRIGLLGQRYFGGRLKVFMLENDSEDCTGTALREWAVRGRVPPAPLLRACTCTH